MKQHLSQFGIMAFAGLALSLTARALDPPPGGGYPGEITALGEDALFDQTDSRAIGNTAIGFEALYSNISGSNNTAVGDSALHDNKSDENTAVGYLALEKNFDGVGNTAVGFKAMESNVSGNGNTGLGIGALEYNTRGLSSTAVGASALIISNGSGNTGVGNAALAFTTSGGYNTAVGNVALAFNATGSFNVAYGSRRAKQTHHRQLQRRDLALSRASSLAAAAITSISAIRGLRANPARSGSARPNRRKTPTLRGSMA